MRTTQWLFFTLLLLNFYSCQKKDLLVGIGEELTLELGDTGVILDQSQELGIEFTQLLEASICPDNADCIWAGRAVVQIMLNKSQVLILGIGDLNTGTSTPFVNSAEYLTYKITLLDVKPKRHTKRSQITLRIDKR